MLWMISLGLLGFLGLALVKPVQKLADARACGKLRIPWGRDFDVKPGAPEIKVLFLGDTGSGNEHQIRVARSAEAKAQELGCDLVMLLGDNFIQEGVSGLDDPQWQSKFEEVYQLDKPFYACLGNHDLRGDWRAQIRYTGKGGRWIMPDTDYQIQAGPVLFQVVNTTCTIFSLKALKKPNPLPWRVMIGHHPVISRGRHGGMTPMEQKTVAKSQVDLVFSGHNHIQEHIRFAGIDQVTTGGGGSPLHRIERQAPPDELFFVQDYGFAWAHFTPEQALVCFFDRDGQETYRFTRQK